MIMIYLSALDENNQVRQFTCGLESLEAGFDFLSRVAANGDTLLSVHLLENRKRIELPVTAFDGFPVSVAIRKLEHEWQAILNQPVRTRSDTDKETIQLIQRRIQQYKMTIAQHQRMIVHYNTWLQLTESSFADDSRRNSLICRYKFMIERHQTQLGRVQACAQVTINRLNTLQLA